MSKTKETNNHGVPKELPRTHDEVREAIREEMERRYGNKKKDS